MERGLEAVSCADPQPPFAIPGQRFNARDYVGLDSDWFRLNSMREGARWELEERQLR